MYILISPFNPTVSAIKPSLLQLKVKVRYFFKLGCVDLAMAVKSLGLWTAVNLFI